MNDDNKRNSINASTAYDLGHEPRIIVSFTSFPGRIKMIPQVLESLYAQSKKPDKILFWLAEEQFPNREKDLPDQLTEDSAAGKFDLRWCDNLGSHKKYFYAMQEYPDDIIVLIDDDTYYHPDTIKTLYEKHLQYPECVVGLHTKVILIDDENNVLPYREWPLRIFIDYPSIQLVPMGGAGVLYPPHSVDPCIFDKDAILSHCCYKGVIFGDDLWLKSHAILSGTTTVTQEYHKVSLQLLPETQTTAIGTLDGTGRSQHEQVLEYVLDRRGSQSEKTVRELLLDAKSKDGFLERNSDVVVQSTYATPIENLKLRIKDYAESKTGANTISKGNLHFYLSSFCMAMTYGDDEQTKLYSDQLRSAFNSVPNINSLAKESLYIRAFIDYSAILLNAIAPKHQHPETYLQMLANWKAFFREHPEHKNEYLGGYAAFLDDMNNFALSEYCDTLEESGQLCRDTALAEWRQLPTYNRIKRRVRKILGSGKKRLIKTLHKSTRR